MPKKPNVQFNKTPQEILQERRARAAVTADQMAGVKRPRQPLGGAPPVKVPPLNASQIDGGGTMQEQAEVLQDPTSPLSPAYSPQMAEMKQKGQLGVLPPHAQQDPNFMPGVGSMIAGNQPFIGQPGQKPGEPYKPQLSEETRADMKALAEFQKQAQSAQQAAAQQAVQQTPKPVPMSAPTSAEGLDEELEETRREIESILNEGEEYNVLNDPDRRKRIEGDLEPMDVTDIIIHGELRQTVPLLDQLSVDFRTASGEEDLEVKRMMYGEKGSDLYMAQKFNTLLLTLSLVGVNDQELPTHLDKDGSFNKELFEAKYKKVLRFPVQILADFCIQFTWFDERVRAMLAGQTEALKNT